MVFPGYFLVFSGYFIHARPAMVSSNHSFINNRPQHVAIAVINAIYRLYHYNLRTRSNSLLLLPVLLQKLL